MDNRIESMKILAVYLKIDNNIRAGVFFVYEYFDCRNPARSGVSNDLGSLD